METDSVKTILSNMAADAQNLNNNMKQLALSGLFTNIVKQPFITMLLTATDFISSNMAILYQRYSAHQTGEE